MMQTCLTKIYIKLNLYKWKDYEYFKFALVHLVKCDCTRKNLETMTTIKNQSQKCLTKNLIEIDIIFSRNYTNN